MLKNGIDAIAIKKEKHLNNIIEDEVIELNLVPIVLTKLVQRILDFKLQLMLENTTMTIIII